MGRRRRWVAAVTGPLRLGRLPPGPRADLQVPLCAHAYRAVLPSGPLVAWIGCLAAPSAAPLPAWASSSGSAGSSGSS
eukprot:12005759-Alexandrium_andersonii.AAC.1